MRNESIKLAELIKKETQSWNKTSFIFLLYFNLWKKKGELLNEQLGQERVYIFLNNSFLKTYKDNLSSYMEYMKKINESSKLVSIDNVINIVDGLFELYGKHYPKSLAEKIETNWNILGYKDIKDEYKNNKAGLQNIVDYIDKVNDFDIINLLEVFECLNISDRSLNDFFTPNDLSQMIGNLSVGQLFKDFNRLDEINIYDCCIGISRLVLHSFYEIKAVFPDKKINVYGIDLSREFAVFSSSVMELINFNNNKIVVGNSLLIEPNFPKMDLIVGNPPFGNLHKVTMEKMIQKDMYLGGSRVLNSSKPIQTLSKKLKPINKTEYEEIINNYEVV